MSCARQNHLIFAIHSYLLLISHKATTHSSVFFFLWKLSLLFFFFPPGCRSSWTGSSQSRHCLTVHRTNIITRLCSQDWSNSQGRLVRNSNDIPNATRSRVRENAGGSQNPHQTGRHGRRVEQSIGSIIATQLGALGCHRIAKRPGRAYTGE